MDLHEKNDDYYDNDNFQEVIDIYENNKLEITKDKDSMYSVIDSFLALRRYGDATKLMNERLPLLISKKSELSEEETEELDFLLEVKIETLCEAKSYFKLLILLIKHGNWIEDRELVSGMYNLSKGKVYMKLFILLLVVFLLPTIRLHYTYNGFIDPIYRSYFRYITDIALGIYLIVIAIVEKLSRSHKPVRSDM